jgi:hypothetical protein
MEEKQGSMTIQAEIDAEKSVEKGKMSPPPSWNQDTRNHDKP